jgi:hypothetical protein
VQGDNQEGHKYRNLPCAGNPETDLIQQGVNASLEKPRIKISRRSTAFRAGCGRANCVSQPRLVEPERFRRSSLDVLENPGLGGTSPGGFTRVFARI